MGLSHADYRPARRSRRVPTGAPKRKLPLIRVALLIALGVFIAARFDDFWPTMREWLDPATLKERVFGGGAADDAEGLLTWSPDSARIAAECPGGLAPGCCRAIAAASPALCGAVRAALAKARWKGALDGGEDGTRDLRVEARALPVLRAPPGTGAVNGDAWLLTAVRGRDARGEFAFLREQPAHSWCDARRGCLKDPAPRTPVEDGRLLTSRQSRQASAHGAATWTSASPRAISVLPGRIIAVDALEEGARVRIYHGRELYTSYEPLRPAEETRPGTKVRAGSRLGDLLRGQSGRYTLTFRVRRGGVNLDPSLLWDPGPPDAGSLSAGVFSRGGK